MLTNNGHTGKQYEQKTYESESFLMRIVFRNFLTSHRVELELTSYSLSLFVNTSHASSG